MELPLISIILYINKSKVLEFFRLRLRAFRVYNLFIIILRLDFTLYKILNLGFDPFNIRLLIFGIKVIIISKVFFFLEFIKA